MPSTSRRVPFGLIAVALYVVSLCVPAIIVLHKPLFHGSPHHETMYGIQCLLIGWLTIPWYANALLFIAALWMAFGRPTVSIVASSLAVVLALSTVFLGEQIHRLHVGYFLWLASSVLTFVAACVAEQHRARAIARAQADAELGKFEESRREVTRLGPVAATGPGAVAF